MAGRKKSTKSAWSNDQRHVNKSQKHELDYAPKRKGKKAKKKKSVAAEWASHLASYRKSHPDLSLKEAMIAASKTYKK